MEGVVSAATKTGSSGVEAAGPSDKQLIATVLPTLAWV